MQLVLLCPDPFLRAVFVRMFSRRDCRILAVPVVDALDALLDRHSVDAVVVDGDHRGVDAVELARRLQQQAPALPVAVLTDEVARMLDALPRAVAVVRKPCTPDDVLDVLDLPRRDLAAGVCS